MALMLPALQFCASHNAGSGGHDGVGGGSRESASGDVNLDVHRRGMIGLDGTDPLHASGSGSIAYQVIGEGPVDLVCVPGLLNHIESAWDEPSFARHYRRLASFCRLVLLDRRGAGLSDRLESVAAPTIEERARGYHRGGRSGRM